MKSVLVLFFVFLAEGLCYSQHVFKGAVLDGEAGEPVSYASVFLTNTTFGVTADENGRFSLKIPEGNYDVIVRMMGYESLSFSISTSTLQSQDYKIILKPALQNLEQIQVEEDRDPVWYRNLQTFKTFFLGTSSNAYACEILNEKDLLLDNDSDINVLRVSAKDVLRINNPNLGYTLEYLLTEFRYLPKEGHVFYGGYPLFIADSTLGKAKLRRVEKRRKEAYLGSLQHFMRTLYDGTTVEEGYEVRRMKRVPNPNRPLQEEIDQARRIYEASRDQKLKDSLYSEVISKERLDKTVVYLDSNPFPPEEMIAQREDGKLFLRFDDLVQITYLHEKESAEFLGKASTERPGPQTSVLTMTGEELEIYRNGSYSDPFGMLVEGYMGWEKVGDLMPLDFNLE